MAAFPPVTTSRFNIPRCDTAPSNFDQPGRTAYKMPFALRGLCPAVNRDRVNCPWTVRSERQKISILNKKGDEIDTGEFCGLLGACIAYDGQIEITKIRD